MAKEYKLFETGDPAEIAAENQEMEMLANELEAAVADLGGGFQIQANLSTADIKAKAEALISKLRSLKNSKNISQRLKTLRSTREFLQAEFFSKNRETVMILASGGLTGKSVLGETLIKVTLALFEAEKLAEKIIQTPCSNWEAVNRILDDFDILMQRTEQLALKILEKIRSDDCVQFGDQRVLMEALNTVVSLGDTNGKGSLQILYTQMNRMFNTLKKNPVSDPLAPGSAFRNELEHLIDSATRISSDIVTQFNRLAEECTSTCLNKARKEFQKNGQTTPVQMDTGDAQCFVYRAGAKVPNNFTPSLADAESTNLLGGLSTSGSHKSASRLPAANRDGVQKISVQRLARYGIYAYYNRTGDDHISLLPESTWKVAANSTNTENWAYLDKPNPVSADFVRWKNSYKGDVERANPHKPYSLPKPMQRSDWLPSSDRKDAIVQWRNIYLSGAVKIDWFNYDGKGSNIEWISSPSNYSFLNKILSSYTSGVGNSVVASLGTL